MGAPVRERWSAVTSRVDRLRMCEAVSEKAQAPSSLPPLRTQPQAVRCQPDSTLRARPPASSATRVFFLLACRRLRAYTRRPLPRILGRPSRTRTLTAVTPSSLVWNERVPNVRGVVTAHEGVAGGVSEAWRAGQAN
jgi:hypothetical protein